MKKTCLGAAMIMTLALAAAQAQEAAPAPAADAASAAPADVPPAVVVNFGLTTNYKFRGQDQGKNRIAVFGGFDYALPYGFYIGNWNSSINFDPHASIEMDLYGGYKGAITPDLTYDVGILQYFYPQNSDQYSAPKVHLNTTELYAALSYSIITLKYSGTVSNDYFGFGQLAKLSSNPPLFTGEAKGRYTGYYDLSANYEMVKGLTLNGHVGYTRFASDLRNNATGPAAKDYADYKFGATYDLGAGFAGAAALVGATERHFYLGGVNNPKVILTITKTM